MKILILGASQVGVSIAEVLVGEDNDVTLVDVNSHTLQQLQDRLDIRTVCGNAAHPTVLRNAGAEDASLVLAVTNSDEVNLVACQIADNIFATPTKIARLRSKEYLNNSELFTGDSGFKVDVLISPEQIVRDHIARLMPGVETRVAAIYRGGDVIMPKSDTIIQEKDEVFFVAARQHIRQVMNEMRGKSDKTKRIFIAGGGNIGLNLALELERKGYSVKLIEYNSERAELIAERVENTIVLNGDAADASLLLQENIENCDVFCAVTERDEINILSAKLAKELGAKRVMALVNKAAYVENLVHLDINAIISPRTATIGSVLAHIRRGDVVAVHALRRGRAEAIEAIAHGDENSSKVIGKGVRDIPFAQGTGVGAIVRDEQVIIPHASTVIEAEDHVIVFIDDKASIADVEALFEVDVTFL